MWQFETSIIDIIPRAPGVKSFRFAIKASNVRYRAGQYFYLTIKIAGKKADHHFSFSSSPTEKDYIEFTKRITESDFSKALDTAKTGEWALLEGPEGHFTLPRKPSKLVYLSGGIGITPIRSTMRYVRDKGLPHDIVLLYGNRSQADIVFLRELDEISALKNIRVEHFLAEPPLAAKRGINNGQIDRAAIARLVPDYNQRLFYISGPPGMVNALSEQVLGMGVPANQIHLDSFTGYE
jgi:ferredoxin-NADP reductase